MPAPGSGRPGSDPGSAGPQGGRCGGFVRYVARVRILAGVALSLAVASCSSADPPAFSQYPIPVDMDTGPVLIDLLTGDDSPPVTATVDTLSPVTIIDSAVPGAPVPDQRRRSLTLTLLASGAGVEPIARARFGGVSTLDLHVCNSGGDTVEGYCRIGLDDATRDIQGILGADLMSRNAVRFAFRDQLMSFFPDIGGSNEDRAILCEAAFPEPFYGGGTMVVGGAEISFSGRRPAVGACFFDRAAELAQGRVCPTTGLAQGSDALFVVSTGLGITILTESTYERYRLLHPEAPTTGGLGTIIVHMPAGPVTARLAMVEDLAVVGEASNNRGPCSERYANDFLSRCKSCANLADDCPCGDRDFCQAGAVVELAGPLQVAVVPDSEPIIQALRAELRPDLPEVSGILGATAMSSLELDVDYPNNRMLARCVDPLACAVRPAVVTAASLDQTRACLPAAMQVCQDVANGVDTCPASTP